MKPSLALLLAFVLALLGSTEEAKAEGGRSERVHAEGDSAMERWRDAPPPERREMRRKMRERLERATPRQRRRIERRRGEFRRLLPDFSPIERMILLRAAADLPKVERESLRRRIRRIDDLESEERRGLVSELEGLIAGYSGEIKRLERNKHRWERLSDTDRAEYREQMKRLRAMSVEERRALLEEMEKGAQGAQRKGEGGAGEESAAIDAQPALCVAVLMLRAEAADVDEC